MGKSSADRPVTRIFFEFVQEKGEHLDKQ